MLLVFVLNGHAQMTTYGSTTGSCDCYLITDEVGWQSGSIWSPNSIDLNNSFDFTFDINVGDIDAAGADGLVFVLRQEPGEPGGGGGGIGYEGILNSIGVEVDTWMNADMGDIPQDHIGVNSNGVINHDLVAPVALPNIEDGEFHSFRITWNPLITQMEVFFDGTSMLTYTGDIVTDIFGGDSEVYFGWTSGTGGSFNKHTVCSYRDVNFTTDHTAEDGITLACPGEEILFFDESTSDLIYDGEDVIEWSWNFGDGTISDEINPGHTYASVGSFTVTLSVKDITGCFSELNFIVVIGGIPLDVTFNEPSCFGFSDGSIVINVPGVLTDPEFIVEDAEGNKVNEENSNAANNLASGWYYFEVNDDSGCGSARDSIFLDQPEELDIDITVTDPLCFEFETGWALVDSVYNTTGDYDGVSYIWNPNPAGVGGEGADSSFAMGAGDYTLTINDDNGCSKVFDFEVDQPDSLYFSEFGFEPAYCRLHEYQSGNGVVFGAAAGGTPDFDYLWTNLETGETINNTTWGGRNPGNYKLIVIDANGCILERTVFLDSLNPIADFSVTSDQLNGDLKGTAPVEVSFGNLSENFANPFNPTADTTFFWNLDRPIADWQVSHDYFEILDTTYTAKGQTYTVDVCLVALNKNGCTDTACKVITIYEPIVFTQINIFTPNGDGINDVFSFDFRSASISEFSAVIVNRWGVVVFEMNDIKDAWDGSDKDGSQCNDGTYFYTYSATTNDGTALKGQGNVSIVR